jgi:glycosyltransferase involved in cell wall biosynthesis
VRVGDRPRVSIGLPVRNGGRLLREAIDSLLAQEFRDFELIVSDNESSDETPSIVAGYAARDPRVIYSPVSRPHSPIENFNRVLGLARGELFMWAAHDDRWDPRFLAELVPEFREESVVLAFSRFDNIDDSGAVVREFSDDWKAVFSGAKASQFLHLMFRDESRSQKANHIYGLMRREVLLACGGMRKERTDFCGEDILALIRMAGKGSFRIVDSVLFHYRVRAVPGKESQQGLFTYLRTRLMGKPAAFRGNFFLYLWRHHVYHSAMRRTLRELPLTSFQRSGLRLALMLRELLAPAWTIPYIVMQELRARRRRVFY